MRHKACETLQAGWEGPLDAPLKYQARGRVVRLALAARAGRPGPGGKAIAPLPGVHGAALDFDLRESGGKAKLVLDGGALDLPGVFEEPVLPFDRLAADLQWQLRGTGCADRFAPEIQQCGCRVEQTYLAPRESAQDRFPACST